MSHGIQHNHNRGKIFTPSRQEKISELGAMSAEMGADARTYWTFSRYRLTRTRYLASVGTALWAG